MWNREVRTDDRRSGSKDAQGKKYVFATKHWFHAALTFDMRGGRQQAKPDVARPLDGRVRPHSDSETHIRLPSAHAATKAWKRLSRVACCFALMTSQFILRR